MKGTMTHNQLVKRAGRWLRNTLHCSVVLEELVTCAREVPDAVGWASSLCILVECKTTHADFLAERNKPVRRTESWGYPCLGAYRFYLTPPGVIRVGELPEGWGLYEVHERSVRFIGGVRYEKSVMSSPPFKSSKSEEVTILLSAIRRVQNGPAIFIRCGEDDEPS